jgi:hypothetical protein
MQRPVGGLPKSRYAQCNRNVAKLSVFSNEYSELPNSTLSSIEQLRVGRPKLLFTLVRMEHA